MNLTILPPIQGKWQGRLGPLALVLATSQGEEKLFFNFVMLFELYSCSNWTTKEA